MSEETENTENETDEAESLLIIEDGTLPENANAYFDVEYLKRYCKLHGSSVFDGKTDTEIEQCIIKNTQYVNSIYDWKGNRYSDEQSMPFPRENIIVDGIKCCGIPLCLKSAICEACIIGITNGSLFRVENEKGDVASESVGGAISLSYFQGTRKEMITIYESINSLLRGFYNDMNKKSIVYSRIMR